MTVIGPKWRLPQEVWSGLTWFRQLAASPREARRGGSILGPDSSRRKQLVDDPSIELGDILALSSNGTLQAQTDERGRSREV